MLGLVGVGEPGAVGRKKESGVSCWARRGRQGATDSNPAVLRTNWVGGEVSRVRDGRGGKGGRTWDCSAATSLISSGLLVGREKGAKGRKCIGRRAPLIADIILPPFFRIRRFQISTGASIASAPEAALRASRVTPRPFVSVSFAKLLDVAVLGLTWPPRRTQCRGRPHPS